MYLGEVCPTITQYSTVGGGREAVQQTIPLLYPLLPLSPYLPHPSLLRPFKRTDPRPYRLLDINGLRLSPTTIYNDY